MIVGTSETIQGRQIKNMLCLVQCIAYGAAVVFE